MFVSKEHLPQLLGPESYRSQRQFDDEIARLFKPAWHCVGLLSELPQDGSYRTFDLLGSPILLWRKDGEVHAFLNVCSHRSCLLTGKEQGCAARLKCQYHGWEYDDGGDVCRIPDARSFRPLEKGMLALKRYHAAVCGQLIFVSLADNPPSLESHLGPGYEFCQQAFHADLETAIVLDREIAANWKVLVENALESYHTNEVHPKTFGTFPTEENCQHDLHPEWTSFTANYADERSFRHWLDGMGHRMVGAIPTHRYQHFLYYPNFMVSTLSLYRWIECIIPLSPTRSRSIVRVMCNVGPRCVMRPWNAFWVRRWARSFLMQVGSEDAALIPHVQRGLNAADRPSGGLISTREERIFHFQKYVQTHVPETAQAGDTAGSDACPCDAHQHLEHPTMRQTV